MLSSMANSSNLSDFEITKNKLRQLQNKNGKDSFKKQLVILREYIESDQSLKEIRSIECGLSFYNDYICINIGNLKNVLGKCKSTINNCLQQMGYNSIKSKSNSNMFLYEAMPSLKITGNVRKWSVRAKSIQPKNVTNIIEIANPLIIPTNKLNECLLVSDDFSNVNQQLSQNSISYDSLYENNDFCLKSVSNDFINNDFINDRFINYNSKFENYSQPQLFDEVYSFF